jgi:hypothetical protein
MARPPAAELVSVMTEGRPKLTAHARRNLLAEVRCPKHRHLLTATVRTAYGPWVLWRGGLFGPGWRCDWWDEIADVAALKAWCHCHSWTIDLSDSSDPRLMR